MHSDDDSVAPGNEYHERLTPSPGTWAAASVIPIGLALCVAPLGPIVALATFVVIGVACYAGLWNFAGTVRLVPGGDAPVLHAGRARIATTYLQGAVAFVGEDADNQRRHRLDPRAYLMLRGWVHGVVRVELDDPGDPTPYWLISSRRPQELAQAINAHVARE